jgi:hypothetical protein
MAKGIPGSRAHGTWSAYTGGCRCDACRTAARVRQRKYREDPERRSAQNAISRAWKDRNRKANQARDREYHAAKRRGELPSYRRPESPFERLTRAATEG